MVTRVTVHLGNIKFTDYDRYPEAVENELTQAIKDLRPKCLICNAVIAADHLSNWCSSHGVSILADEYSIFLIRMGKLIKVLLDHNYPTTIQEIRKQMGVTKKTFSKQMSRAIKEHYVQSKQARNFHYYSLTPKLEEMIKD